jgi:hypothetical protein
MAPNLILNNPFEPAPPRSCNNFERRRRSPGRVSGHRSVHKTPEADIVHKSQHQKIG